MGILCFVLERPRVPAQELAMTRTEVEELVAALEAERERCWVGGRGSPVKAWAAFAERNHEDFNYPTSFAELLGDTLEIRLFMARQHLRILQANLLPTASDTVQIGIEWTRGVGFRIKGGFLDSLSKSISMRRHHHELRIPNDAELSVAMVRPSDAVKAWNAHTKTIRLSPDDGGWRESPPLLKPRLRGTERAEEVKQRVSAEIINLQRRNKLNMAIDPSAGPQLGQLLAEQFDAERGATPDNDRVREVWDDLALFNRRREAMKELGLVMPPDPEGLNDMLRKCTETLEITREITPRFITLGRKDTPVPLSFHWRFHGEIEDGVLFIIRFNEPDGPLGARYLRMDAMPIRALIAPHKAVAEWKALCEQECINPNVPAARR